MFALSSVRFCWILPRGIWLDPGELDPGELMKVVGIAPLLSQFGHTIAMDRVRHFRPTEIRPAWLCGLRLSSEGRGGHLPRREGQGSK